MRALLTSPLVELFHQLLRGQRPTLLRDDIKPQITCLFVTPEGSGHYIADEHTAQATVLVGYVNKVIITFEDTKREGDDGLFTVFKVAVSCFAVHPRTESSHNYHITLFQSPDDHDLPHA